MTTNRASEIYFKAENCTNHPFFEKNGLLSNQHIKCMKKDGKYRYREAAKGIP